MKNKSLTLFLTFLIFFGLVRPPATAKETCARTATIEGGQEILIDTGNAKKGEGLRFFLEKDPMAKKYLDTYQEKISPKWYQAALGTLGTTLIIFGLGKSGGLSEPQNSGKRAMIIGGASILILNFLLVKTIEYNIENLLLRSIEEYNKRNMPKIYFGPLYSPVKSHNTGFSFGIGGGITKDF